MNAPELLDQITRLVGERHFSIGQAAARLDFSVKYIREHLQDFPNAWRAPGGEIRIPEHDLAALAARNKLNRK